MDTLISRQSVSNSLGLNLISYLSVACWYPSACLFESLPLCLYSRLDLTTNNVNVRFEVTNKKAKQKKEYKWEFKLNEKAFTPPQYIRLVSRTKKELESFSPMLAIVAIASLCFSPKSPLATSLLLC